MLRKDNIQHAIRGQLGIEQLGGKLKKCLRETEKLKDWAQVRETVMDYAKLTGQLVEKREVKTVTPEQSSAILSLVRRTFPLVAPTTQMSLPVAEIPADAPASATLSPSAATVESVVTSFNAASAKREDN